MPFPGEHSARQKNPDLFLDDTFQRMTEGMPEGVALIMGRLKSRDQLDVQSVRFQSSLWTPAKARKWLEGEDYSIANFEEATEKRWSMSVPISKLASEEKLAFGWASVVADESGNAVIDHQEDRISIPELEKAAYEYVQSSRQSTEMHDKLGVAELVESCMITPEKRKAMGMPEGITGWWVGFRVVDPSVWNKVKDGTYSEFSIGGSAKRKKYE
tara:strand:- start:10133 stop:10774 length:642 start_codon:yes stop_codon:yes gene_type:complete